MHERIAWTVGPRLVTGLGRVVWRLEIEPGDELPQPPFVVAANHHSFLDPFVIGGVFRNKIRFLALDDLFGNYSLVDHVLTVFDVIRIKRGTVPLGPLRVALAHLSEGGAVGLFPEGTRHWVFDASRARPGAAWLAVKAGVPLVPVALIGTDRVLGVDNRLHTGRIRVVIGPRLHGSGDGRAATDDLHRRWAGWVDAHIRATA